MRWKKSVMRKDERQAELTAINLRKLGLPLEQIAHAVGFHVEKVEKWVK